MHRLEFTLRQHTPLIHFQHGQDGATLRATEVKPKLDRFIINKIGGIETVKNVYPNWLISLGNNDGLNYKLRIRSKGDPVFTNHRIITEDFVGVSYASHIFLVTTNLKSLNDALNENIEAFFSSMNFGRRSSKGYGSFTIDKTSESDFIEALKEYSGNNLYKYRDDNIPNIWEERIKVEWNRLKSGRNRPYEKSRIFKYASARKRRWEKRWMKLGILDEISNDNNLPNLLYDNEPLDCSFDENVENYNSIEENKDLEFETDDDYAYCFYRALLGLPELYEFRAENNLIYQFKITNETVNRFKSPVTFKVFNGKLYAIPEPFNRQILNQNFQMDLILKTNRGEVIKDFNCLDGRFDISTPERFDLLEFLGKFFNSVGFTKL